MIGDGSGASTHEAARQLADSFRDVLELRSRTGEGIALVRPDGYLAFSTRHHGAAALEPVRSTVESMVR
jgi:hypothetical protein